MMKTTTSVVLTLTVLFFAVSISAFSQNKTTISGTVKDGGNDETLAGVNIIVKGTVLGTITDFDGKFKLIVNSAPPITIQASFIGFNTQEIEILESSTTDLEFSLEESFMLGQEIVVSASRVEESILESASSIEKLNILAIQNTASDDYYKGLANLKGVDINSSSINFQIVNARGFNSNGNTRFVQLNDGMDTQAPGLNFPIGNLNGPSVLDVESLELIPGASSAIYGANAFNGILLISSKSAFDYQGVSAYVKTGVNHIHALGDGADQEASPMLDFALRYAKALNNKFAFKVNLSYMRADDWNGTSEFDRNEGLNPFQGSDKIDNISGDRLHYMGDEATLNMNILRFSSTSPGSVGWETLASSGIGVYEPGVSAWGYAQTGFLPNHIVAAPAYAEKHIVDYGAENFKTSVGLYYRLTDKVELSYLFNYGFGTTVYTGAQRYSLNNFAITQHRLQLRGDNFFLRTYTTREKSGDSYIAEFLAKRINDERYGGDVANYLTEYPLHYLQSIYDQGYLPTGNAANVTDDEKIVAHLYAMQTMNDKYPMEAGGDAFNTAKAKVKDGVVPVGPKFNDASNMYHLEGQYNFKNQIDFVDLQVGATYRAFELKSNGTVFDDKEGVTISEFGAYTQLTKKLNKIKFIGSMRYDKNVNFDGQISPKFATVWTFIEGHNIRGSIQQGFRNPATQAQYIDLDIISARLLGGLQKFSDKYEITTNTYPVKVVDEYTNQIFEDGTSPFDPANVAILLGNEFTEHEAVKPEKVTAIEVGYKSLIANKLMLDFAYYYNRYNDFITQLQIRKYSVFTAADGVPANLIGTPNYASLLRGSSLTYVSEGVFEGNTAQIYTNIEREVTAQGAIFGVTYNLPKGYLVSANYNWNVLNDEEKLTAEGFISEFNTPANKFNMSFGNRKVTDKIGFNIAYRWQDTFLWQSSFAEGDVPAFATIDAQVSYKLDRLKSIIKLGGSNLLNKSYTTSLGSPNMGAIYYLSVTFDQFLN